MYLMIALALLLAVCLSGEAGMLGPVHAPGAQPVGSTPTVPPGGGTPSAPGVTTPPSGAYVVQQLSPQAAAEVQHGVHVLHGLQQGVEQRRGRLTGFEEWAAQYRARVQQAAHACQTRTYSAADNVSAGCGNRDTPGSCERKLLDWCMGRDARFKVDRDQNVHLLKQAILSLQPLVQQADQIYPR